ncbi:threonine synthase [Kribbella sp. NPDC004138]
MTFSALSHLECPRCGATHDADQIIGLCPCGSPLLARYGVPAFGKADLAARAPDLWRYHELLPVRSPSNVVTLGEGMTPLLPMARYGASIGVERLLMKDEGLIPTGTFKARGAAVGVSRAYEVGVRKIAMPTNGNAGSAWAAYAARAGMEALIAMPIAAPEICRREVTAVGARLQLIDGLIGDAAAYVRSQSGYFDASTLKEPYRIEGKKTMGLEIAEQLGWSLPDVIVYPTGGGVGIIGIWKALTELRDLGWISGPLPRLVAVQSTGCAPIVRAWEKGLAESEPWPDARTVAFGITVPKALGDFLVLQAIAETGGCAVAVDDADILAEQHLVARLEGTFICPEGAANFAAIRTLRDSCWITADDQVVALNTGAGLKYPETVQL